MSIRDSLDINLEQLIAVTLPTEYPILTTRKPDWAKQRPLLPVSRTALKNVFKFANPKFFISYMKFHI